MGGGRERESHLQPVLAAALQLGPDQQWGAHDWHLSRDGCRARCAALRPDHPEQHARERLPRGRGELRRLRVEDVSLDQRRSSGRVHRCASGGEPRPPANLDVRNAARSGLRLPWTCEQLCADATCPAPPSY